ncbi:valine--pyruvate transaminase [Leptospira sp. 96542]|nr:valine--pyruvate transaminase [Leptospira sp. 96542]
MERSKWAARLDKNQGIRLLMDDLGRVSGDSRATLLGGGNPAHIPAAEEIFHESFKNLEKDLSSLLGDYQAPIGNDSVREITADYLSPYFQTKLKKENIAFFNGSQNAFFYLLNLFSGKQEDGSVKKILLPIVPEYIGYADQAIEENTFVSNLPKVVSTGKDRFQYQMDKSNLSFDNAGCVLLSRPTNPTGNVVSLGDLDEIQTRANQKKIPVLIDLAYGNPFPNLLGEEDPVGFCDGRVLSLSFSKVGLPGVRLGIVIADEKTISLLSNFASVGNLAPGNLGLFLAKIFFENDTLPKLSQNILRPFYENKKQICLEVFEREFVKWGVEYSIHEPMGGFFLWIRFPRMNISNAKLYQLCKDKRVFFVSGHFFFPGLSEDFSHTKDCIRLTYCREEEELARGAKIIAEMVASHQAKPE